VPGTESVPRWPKESTGLRPATHENRRYVKYDDGAEPTRLPRAR
jgi:hypothetical protein